MSGAGPALVRPKNALERALVEGDRATVLATLAREDVYVRVVPAGDDLALGTIEHDGTTYVAAFSSLDRLAGYDAAGGDYVRVAGRALAASRPPLPVVLDPGGNVGVVLDLDEVARLELAPHPPEPWLLVGEPAHEPEALLAAIRALAEREPAVRAAYRGLVLRRGAPAAELVVALELEEDADAASVVRAAAAAARDAGVESLALLVLADDELSRLLVERTQPFSTR